MNRDIKRLTAISSYVFQTCYKEDLTDDELNQLLEEFDRGAKKRPLREAVKTAIVSSFYAGYAAGIDAPFTASETARKAAKKI